MKTKTVGYIIIVMITVIAILFIALLPRLLSPLKGVERMQKDFNKNKDFLQEMTNYLINLEYEHEYVYITSPDQTMFLGSEYGEVKIMEKKINRLIKILFFYGYDVIEKGNNCVIFLRWRNLDCGSGLVYSVDGHVPDESSLQFLTKLEPLIENGWYYYEEDYIEWKRLNK